MLKTIRAYAYVVLMHLLLIGVTIALFNNAKNLFETGVIFLLSLIEITMRFFHYEQEKISFQRYKGISYMLCDIIKRIDAEYDITGIHKAFEKAEDDRVDLLVVIDLCLLCIRQIICAGYLFAAL